MQERQCSLCAKTNLHIRFFITKTFDSLRLINQSIKKQFHRIEYLIIGNTACNKVRTPVLVALAAGIANILVVFPLGKADALTLNVLACCTAAFTILRYGVFQPYYAAKILARNRLFFYGTLLRNVLATVVIGVVLYAAKGLFTYGSWGHFFIAIALCGAVGYVLAFFLLFNPGEYKEIVHMFLSKMKKKTA